jgi:hypothetical protein
MTAGGMFARWCALNAVTELPAAPADVAKFVADCAPLGIEQVWPLVGDISRAHSAVGLADPTLGGPVSAAINEIAKVDPPRSWPKAHKARFLSLPYDLQVYVSNHEVQREKEVRRAHNEAAQARKDLASIQQPTKATNGNEPNATAA